MIGLYGYRHQEVLVREMPVTDESVEIIQQTVAGWSADRPLTDELKRPIEQVGLPVFSEGFACPHPDTGHRRSAQEGALYRVGAKVPEAEASVLADFHAYVCRHIRKRLRPLQPETSVEAGDWLPNTNYPLWRQEELLQVEEKYVDVWEEANGKFIHFTCKSFVKAETYLEFKPFRLINARSDRYKVAVGPTYSLIEKLVFANSWFIKKVPHADRPEYIKQRLSTPGSKIYATDFSQYESSFTEGLMSACEMALYSWMVQHLPSGRDFMDLVGQSMLRTNECKFRSWILRIWAKRMSGEMCTSLGNGFTNKMAIKYLAYRRHAKVKGVVEGDDSLYRIVGARLLAEDFALLGLKVKLEEHIDFNTASFCGLVFDELDCVNVTNPAKVLATFGWTGRRYLRASHRTKMALLRSKALSIAHQYPGCPILGHLARGLLRLTRSYDVRRLKVHTWWESEKLAMQQGEVPWREPPIRTRLLVERLYGFSVECQRRLEEHFDLMELGPLKLEISHLVPECWRQYWDWYSTELNSDTPARGWPALGSVHDWDPSLRREGCIVPGRLFRPWERGS